MSKRRSHKKNRRSFNARNNGSSSNSVPTPRVNDLPQELPPQELPPQELLPQELPPQELPPQELPPQELPAQVLPAQELSAQELPPMDNFYLQPNHYFGDTYDIYLPINRAGPSMTMEELRAHPFMETLQRAAKEKQFLYLEFHE